MKNKITPEYVLVMLQELKKSLNEGTFVLNEFSNKYPTYIAFRKQLYAKGIIAKKNKKAQWISIEPNIIMSKELIKLYLSYAKETQQKFFEKRKEKGNNTEAIPETNQIPELEEPTFEKPTLEKSFFDNNPFEDYISSLKVSLANEQTANQSLKQILKEAQRGIDENVKMLMERISVYKKDIEEKNAMIEELELELEEVKKSKLNSIAPASKTFKLLGIPFFSITNK